MSDSCLQQALHGGIYMDSLETFPQSGEILNTDESSSEIPSGTQHEYFYMNVDDQIHNEIESTQRILIGQLPFTRYSHLSSYEGIDHLSYSNDFNCKTTVRMESFMDLSHEDNVEELQPLQPNSYNVQMLSSLTQQNNNSTIPLNSWSQDEKSQHEVKMIPVLRPLLAQFPGINNYVHYESWKGMLNGHSQSPSASDATDAETCQAAFRISSDSNEEFSELRTAVASITDSASEETEFQNFNMDENCCKFMSSQELLEEPTYFQRKDCSSVETHFACNHIPTYLSKDYPTFYSATQPTRKAGASVLIHRNFPFLVEYKTVDKDGHYVILHGTLLDSR
ncbi:uncharacterized protein O3C94_021617 [Discoglossus pictus]